MDKNVCRYDITVKVMWIVQKMYAYGKYFVLSFFITNKVIIILLVIWVVFICIVHQQGAASYLQ